jgi:hypothetical protein
MVATLNYYSFAFNNFVFGGQGSPYQVTSVTGLEGPPPLRVQDSDRGYQDGMFTGRDFLSGRQITVNILTLSGNGNSAQTNFNLLQASLLPQQNGTSPLQFQLSSAAGLQIINARVRSGMTQIDPDFTFGYIKSQYTFFAPNPLYFDNALQSASVSPSAIGGRTYNRTYPLTYPAGSQTGSVIVNNAGTTATYPTLTLFGPVTNPTIGNQTSGGALNFNYTMGASDVFIIDLYNRTILLNGVPARNLLLGSSTWFNAAPGSSQFYFTGSGYTFGTTSAIVQWQNAYL